MIFLQSLSDLLLAHPFAIVDHLIQNTVFFSGNVDLHRALPDHTAETVVDGILYDRLQKEFQRFVVFQARLHMDINKDPVEIFEVDQVDVVPDQIDLVLNPDDLPAVLEENCMSLIRESNAVTIRLDPCISAIHLMELSVL